MKMGVVIGLLGGVIVGWYAENAVLREHRRVAPQWRPWTGADPISWDIAWEVMGVDGVIRSRPCAPQHATDPAREHPEFLPDWGGVRVRRYKTGWLVVHDMFTGDPMLEWYSADGRDQQQLSTMWVLQLIEVHGEMMALYRSREFEEVGGGLLRLVRDGRGSWQAVAHARFVDTPVIAALDRAGRIVALTAGGVVRVTRDRVVQSLEIEMPWGDLEPNSLVLSSDDVMYAGVYGGIIAVNLREPRRALFAGLTTALEVVP